jgi:hypothetical protein
MILGVGVALLLVKLNVDFRATTFSVGKWRVGPQYWPPLFQLFNFFIYMALGAVLAPMLLKNLDRLRSAILVCVAVVCALIIVGAMEWISPRTTSLIAHWPIIRRDTFAMIGTIKIPVGTVFALLSVACALAVAALLQRAKFAGFVKTMGQYSLYIFVLHVIFAAGIRTVLLKLGVKDVLPHVVAGCAVGVLVPIGVAMVARRTKTTWLFSLRGS